MNPLSVSAASNPVPLISEISPTAVVPGGSDFTLTVLGTGLINGQSVIRWNGTALPDPTTCTEANSPQSAYCTVTVRAAMIATPTTAAITVVNPNNAPATGTSNIVSLPISSATSNVATTQRDFSTGATVNALLAEGDFNGDGNPDLVTLNSVVIPCTTPGTCQNPSYVVTTMLGDGAGNFSLANVTAPLGFVPSSMAVGDFNGDGKLDLALMSPALPCAPSCATSPTITPTILLGDGTGKFTDLRPAPTGTPISGPIRGSLMVGDFNGDGILDIVTPDLTTLGNIAVFLGDGKGGFSSSDIHSGENLPVILLAGGDFNGDGRLDLALVSLPPFACPTCSPGSAALTILLGDGAGGFTVGPASVSVGPNPTAIAVGDFNGDGRLDLAVANSCINNPDCQSGWVTVLLGDGTGNFIRSGSISNLPQGASTMLTGDFNGDGNLDLALGEYPLTILLGDGSGGFSANPALLTPAPAGYALAAGDFNKDGRLDLVLAGSADLAASSSIPGSSDNGISVLLQTRGLVISKTHSGNFWPGQTGATYSMVVTNSDLAPSNGTVTVTDTVPSLLTAISLAGTGWDCSSSTFPVSGDGTLKVSCTRSDFLAAGSSYPPITLTVDVALGPLSFITNRATVSFEGPSVTTINSASDPTFITPFPQPAIIKSHVGSFVQGQTGATYTISTSNIGSSLTGTFTITDMLPAGLIATDMSGTGWLCTLGTITCTRSDGLGAKASYPPISVTVDVAASAPTTVINRAQYSISGGSVSISGLFSDRPTIINPLGPIAQLSLSSLSFVSQAVGGTGTAQVVALLNIGNAALNIASITGSAQFAETNNCGASLPPGASCNINVTFTPKTGGTQLGTLTVADDAPGGSQTVSLSGAGKDFSLLQAPGSGATANVTAGQPASFPVILAAAGGFNQQVSFMCTGAPSNATCTVNPASLKMNPVAPTAILVSVTTTASTVGLPQAVPSPMIPGPPPFLVWWGAIVLAGVLVAGARPSRSRVPRRLVFGMILLMVTMIGAFSIPGCGGGAMPQAVVHSVGTPAGTYTLNVTGTFSAGDTTLTHSVQLTLTVH